jgi:CBS domain.
MTTHNVRNLPVVENNEIVGEITIHHLIKKFYGIINSLGDEQ